MPGIHLAECPVSYITGTSLVFLKWYQRFKVLAKAGVAPYGSLETWPVWAVDTVEILEAEYRVEQQAREYIAENSNA